MYDGFNDTKAMRKVNKFVFWPCFIYLLGFLGFSAFMIFLHFYKHELKDTSDLLPILGTQTHLMKAIWSGLGMILIGPGIYLFLKFMILIPIAIDIDEMKREKARGAEKANKIKSKTQKSSDPFDDADWWKKGKGRFWRN